MMRMQTLPILHNVANYFCYAIALKHCGYSNGVIAFSAAHTHGHESVLYTSAVDVESADIARFDRQICAVVYLSHSGHQHDTSHWGPSSAQTHPPTPSRSLPSKPVSGRTFSESCRIVVSSPSDILVVGTLQCYMRHVTCYP